jgi:transforming growth factor-beta-induced protein
VILSTSTLLDAVAWLQALTRILLYHVLGGSLPKASLTTSEYPSLDGEKLTIDVTNGTFTVNTFSVVSADNQASNGYVHVIDDVLVPTNAGLPSADSTLSQYLDDAKLFDPKEGYKEFAQVGGSEGVYAEILKNPNRSTTAFAPALGALNKLPSVLLMVLRLEEKAPNGSTVLKAFMKHQLVDGLFWAKDVLNATSLTSLEGESISVRVTNGQVLIGDVPLVAADYAAAHNGLFHTLETYLVPKQVDGLPSRTVAQIAGEASIFTAAARQAARDAAKTGTPNKSLDPDAPDANTTVFVPSDAAFGAIATPSQLGYLLTELPLVLAKLLSEHIVPTPIFIGELGKKGPIKNLNGDELTVSSTANGTQISAGETKDSRVGNSENGTNGVVFPIDKVLIPNKLPSLPPMNETIWQTLNAQANFSDLISLLMLSKYDSLLDNATQSLTLLAPTNAAFAPLKANKPLWKYLSDPANAATLGAILTNHVILSRQYYNALCASSPSTLQSAHGDTLNVTCANGILSIDGKALSFNKQLPCSNGAIQALETAPLVPANVQLKNLVDISANQTDLTTLVRLVIAANLSEALGTDSFTIIAPNNVAFGRILTGILGYLEHKNPTLLGSLLQRHVIPGAVYAADLTNGAKVSTLSGESLTVSITSAAERSGRASNANGSVSFSFVNEGNITVSGQVLQADVTAANGVIHIIDHVLLDPASDSHFNPFLPNTPLGPELLDPKLGLNLTEFSKYVNQAIPDELTSAGPITVFAPSNQAFEADPAVADLGPDSLNSTIKLHFVNGIYYAADLARIANTSTQLTTISGQLLTVTTDAARQALFIQGSQVTATNDVAATNGVLHVIDRLIEPTAPAPSPSDDSGLSGGVVVLIVLGALLAIGIVGYFVHKHYFSKPADDAYGKLTYNPMENPKPAGATKK